MASQRTTRFKNHFVFIFHRHLLQKTGQIYRVDSPIDKMEAEKLTLLNF